MKKRIVYIVLLVLVINSLLLLGRILIKSNNKDILNSLVYIESYDKDTTKSGSGFVYKVENNNAYILTNYHVISGYSNIYVYNKNKEKAKAIVINYDEYNDIAVLLLNNSLNLKKSKISTKFDVNKSDKIYIVGNPMGIENFGTIVEGYILSNSFKIEAYPNFNSIKVSANTDYGNSGGPLLNSNGEVIGMMFLRDKENSNESFAIPIDFVMERVEEIENRINLGAVMTNSDNTTLLNEYGLSRLSINGVVILDIIKDGLLDKNGVIKGDIITKVNEISVNNVADLRSILYDTKHSDILDIELFRENEYYTIKVEI